MKRWIEPWTAKKRKRNPSVIEGPLELAVGWGAVIRIEAAPHFAIVIRTMSDLGLQS